MKLGIQDGQSWLGEGRVEENFIYSALDLFLALP